MDPLPPQAHTATTTPTSPTTITTSTTPTTPTTRDASRASSGYSQRSTPAQGQQSISCSTAVLSGPRSHTSSLTQSPTLTASSPPPPAIRIHCPHTPVATEQTHLSLSLQQAALRNANSNGTFTTDNDEKRPPSQQTAPASLPPRPTSQLEPEKPTHWFPDYSPTFTPSNFQPVQINIASPAGPYAAAAPLYYTTFAHNPDPYGQSTAPLNSSPPWTSHPHSSDLEMQHHAHYQRHETPVEADTQSRSIHHGATSFPINSQCSMSQPSSSSSRHVKRRSVESDDIHRKKSSDIGSISTRSSHATTAIAADGVHFGSTSSSHHSSKPAVSKSSPGHRRHDVQKATRHQTSILRVPDPAHYSPPKKGFSLFRWTLSSFGTLDKAVENAPQSRRKMVSERGVAYDRKAGMTRSSSRRRLVNDMAAYLPYSGGHGRAGSAGKDQEYRKTGIPGRNGEEPETNVFNFVDIMMNMPENPSWQQIIKKLLKTMAVMTISYFLLMSLFFAAEFESTKHLENISILVVDLDKSVIGNMFLNFTQQDNKYPGQVNWSVQSGYKDVASVISDVENGNYWGAMVAQANASMILNKALATPLADYDPTKAFLFVYDGGRDPLAVKPYVVASMYTQFLEFTKVFNPAWVKFVLQFADENSKAVTPLMNAPQVLGTPVAFEELDLHPPTATIITSATSVAYIWVFLIAGGSTYLVAHAVQPMTRHATVTRTMTMLLLPLLAFLCSLSMTYTILLRIFGVPFESAGQFMSLFMGMLLLQSAVASLVLFLIFLIPVVFIPLVTITFVVMNVIAVFNPVDLMPTFYRWVYAMPFLNAVQMARYVLMGSYNRLNYNLPILFAWIIVPITLLPFAIARQKRLMMEIMEPEEQERQQRYHADKERSYGRYADSGQEEDYYDRYDDDAYYCGDKSMRHDHRRRSREFERFRSGRSKHHYRGRYQADEYAMSHDQDEDIMDGEGSDDDGEEDRSDGREDSSYDRIGALNASRLIRPPLNSRAIGGGVVSPSAPPESQIFDLHNRAAGRDQDNNRSYIEMPKLSRHPYASELVQAQSTPDEVKQ